MQQNDLEERDMIGDLLNEDFENPVIKKNNSTPNRPPALQIQGRQQSPVYKPKVYSPQVQHKANSYDLDIKLKKVPVVQSTPNSALKTKSYDGLQQFIPTDEITLDCDIISKCKDQNGARSIQKQFEEADAQKRDYIFTKLEKGIVPLSKDVFGNYVIQNLLEFCTPQQQQKVLQALQPHIQQLAFHMYGCRVLQKLLQNLHNTNEFSLIFDSIKGKVKELVIDQHGNHVVQKLVQLKGQEISSWLLEGIQDQINKLVTNSFGCRIIQKAVQISQKQQDKLMIILKEIMNIAEELCVSQYGNYIIQQLLKESPKQIQEQIQFIITKNLEEFSLNKFGSNVVDCAIQCSDNQFKRKIMELMLAQKNNQVLFVRLSINAYGNYVVQNFLKSVDAGIQKEFYIKIHNSQLFQEIQQSQFGQYVYQLLASKLELETFQLQ